MPIFEEMVPCGTKRPYSQTTNGMDNMTKEELKALGLTEEQVAKVADDYEKTTQKRAAPPPKRTRPRRQRKRARPHAGS